MKEMMGDDNSTTTSGGVLSPISLLSFNLEPLTDTLENLELSDNGFTVLPMQFQGRSFARLRQLDFSHNPIKGTNAFNLSYFLVKNYSFGLKFSGFVLSSIAICAKSFSSVIVSYFLTSLWI